MNALVGYTGFVGSNLFESGAFDAAYNSQNIQMAFGTNPDLLVYAGVRAEKYLANNDPGMDLDLIKTAENNILRINPKKIVLISTIDVFKTPLGVDENTSIDMNGLHPYGYNRFLLECWVKDYFKDVLVVRLPGLFGKNIKKNFIYDYINYVPYMLKEEKFKELSEKETCLLDYYEKISNGFYKLKLTTEKKEFLKYTFKKLGFSALYFTDSRSTFQFYNLANLWNDICIALRAGIKTWHAATEPVSARELYRYLTGDGFINILPSMPAEYDCRTIYDYLFGGRDGYICSKEKVMEEIKLFVES